MAIDADDKNYERQSLAWKRYGIALGHATTMHEALELLSKREYIAIYINADCIEYVQMIGIIRGATMIPILVMKKEYDASENTRALSHGADAFDVWAPDPEDTVKRGVALVWRYHRQLYQTKQMSPVLVQGDIRVYMDYHRVFVGPHEVSLCRKEYKLLIYFMENPGRVLSSDQILKYVWNEASYEAVNWQVWGQIKNLRAKLISGKSGVGNSNYIQTVIGFGYRFSAPDSI